MVSKIDRQWGRDMVRAWTVRGGRHGEREDAALDGGLVIAGWEQLGDLTECKTIDDLGTLLRSTYPGEAPRTLENWKHQLWRFRSTMAVDDLVVMPRKYRKVVAIGRLTGDYEFRADAPAGLRHVRGITWIRKDVDRAVVDGDLRDSMGAFLTISELNRRDASARVAALAESGKDPGYHGYVEPPTDFEALRLEVAEVGTRQLTARDLIGLAGWQRRTAEVIDIVDRALADLALQVEPHFTEVPLDGLVTVSALESAEAAESTNDLTPEPQGGQSKGVADDLALRIAHLPLSREVLTIDEGAPLERAITWLVEGRCTQLPVVDAHQRLRGVISLESLAKTGLAGRAESLVDAMDRHPKIAREQEELFSRIDDIRRHGHLIIVDSENVVVGLLSAADLAQQLKQRIRPFIVLEELERRLRRAVSGLSVDELRAALGRNTGKASKIKEPKDLTFGNYPFLLDDDVRWSKLDWPYEREDIVTRLREVVTYRNDLAHWAVDAPAEDVKRLATAEQLLVLLKAIDRDPSS
ncbi:restriction system protein [Streptacidiphilus sp. BW17]|uniref:CBS domain-containing protein n=1 Tax=Streptacidiphilus sp. BW17 TaxID=3156274 RepID=UPI003518638E